jgi:hypothetical protein
MPLDPILRVVADHWDSVEGLLDDQAADRFRLLIRRICAVDVAASDRDDAVDELVDLLLRKLPADHAVQQAIANEAGFRSVATQEYVQAEASAEEPVLAELRRLLDDENRNSPDAILRDAAARLLAAPAWSAAELRGRGGNPDQAHLISLDGPDGWRLPVFQFDSRAQPIPVVLDINALLDASADPWGAADWWIGLNAWLGRTPAESLGRVADQVLLDAARATAEGD